MSIDYKLPANAYATFDATTLKDLIKSRLNESGQFTDQNYEGSNLSAVIDIIALSYHVLLFYLNNTASETMFSQATLYENMSKIVSVLGYKPTGKQTAQCSLSAVASADLSQGNYTIRKYSYFLVDNIQYTFNRDYSFNKVTTSQETIESLNDTVILYQGSVNEYPHYFAQGSEFEAFPIVVENIVNSKDTRFIAANTISVYVKEVESGTYQQYTEVDNLYLVPSTYRGYEVRLNENGNYEIKFGNGIAGKILNAGDEVVVYYLLSNNDKGIISKNAINGNKLYVYANQTFDQIYSDITPQTQSTLINSANNSLINFSNPNNSTVITSEETVDQIRANVPKIFSQQLRLVTTQDYEILLSKSLAGILQSVKVADNNLYMSQYIDYYYKINADPNKSNRVVVNQLSFADSCDFNNVNIFCVPQFSVSDKTIPPYLSESFKNLIIEVTRDRKMLSHEVVPRDPVYMAYDLGFTNSGDLTTVSDSTYLVVVRDALNKTSKDTIRKEVYDTIINFFSPQTNKLGQTVSLQQLTSSILNINGVKQVRTENNGLTFNGISFVVWNPLYQVDSRIVNQDETLQFFQFPFLYRPISLVNNIKVIDE